MAGERDLPRWLDAVHPTRRVPHRAELAVAVAVIAVVLVADVRGAIGFSSFAVLFYYAVANASAFTLTRRRAPLAPRPPRGWARRVRRPRVLAPRRQHHRRRGAADHRCHRVDCSPMRKQKSLVRGCVGAAESG